MAPYGRGQLLGSTIDPRFAAVDYSPYVNAAATQGQMMANIGQTIGDIGKQFGEYKKQQSEDERLVQKSKSVAKAIGDLIPELQPTIQESMMILDNKEIPLSRRKAEAEAISDILNLGINEVRNRQEYGLKSRELGMREAANIAEISGVNRDYETKSLQRTAKKIPFGSVDLAVVEDGFGNIYDPATDRPITNLEAYAEGRDDFGPSDLPQDGMVLPPREFPDGVPVDGVPVPPAGFNFDQMPALPGEAPVAPETIQAIEAVAPQGGLTPRGIPRTTAQASEKETFRPATPEESAQYGGIPGQMSSSGRFYPINLPSGMTIESDGKGGIKVVQGSGVGKKDDKEQKSEEAVVRNAEAIMQDLNLLEDRSESMAPGIIGAVGRMVGEKIPATEIAQNKEIIDRVLSKLTLGSLQEIRNNSPTGGSLGSITDADIKLLRNSATSLKNAQSREAFQQELTRLQNLQYDIIHGDERTLKSKLEKGEITKEQYESARANAPTKYLDERGRVQTRQPKVENPVGIDLTPDEEELLNKKY